MGLYGWDNTAMAMKTLWSTSDIGQGPGAASFQIGDFNGDRRAEIVQLWNNGGKLALIVYGWDSAAMAMKTLWSADDLRAGPSAEWWVKGRADNGMGGQYHSKDTSIGVPHLAHKPEQFVARLCFEDGAAEPRG
jgi:hypothetical protein